MTTNQVLAGVGLILVLAVGSQVLASRLRIPALIVLLPAGFIAGAMTTDVNPQRLLGAAFDLACGLRSAGLDVLMWAGLEEERERIRHAGLELAPGELLAAATGRGAELEGINAVLLLTTEDDFNALASAMLAGSVEGAVYRLGPQLPSHGVVAPYTGGQILFGTGLTRYDVGRRYVAGARITSRLPDGELPAGTDLLFLVRSDGKLMPVTTASTPAPQSGDTMIVLESVLTGA